jgi:hypothetical protein
MDVKADRERIATAIRGGVPTKWTVYSGPPVTEVLPCIIVAPGSPYLERVTFSQSGGWEASLRLLVMQQVAAGEVALDVLDGVLAELLPDLLLVEEMRLQRVDTVQELQTRAGVPAIVASIPIVI